MSKLSEYIAAQEAEEAQSPDVKGAIYLELHNEIEQVFNELDRLINFVMMVDHQGNKTDDFSLEKFDPEVAGELLSVLRASVKYLKGEDESAFKPAKQKKTRERKPRDFGKAKNVGKVLGRIP